jgi:hypothetical protein
MICDYIVSMTQLGPGLLLESRGSYGTQVTDPVNNPINISNNLETPFLKLFTLWIQSWFSYNTD